MPRFCVNLTMLFNEHEFLERFDAAAACFKSVEYLFGVVDRLGWIKSYLSEEKP